MEKVEGAYDVVILKQKINEIIDHLNSQAQPEEKIIPIIGEVKPMSKKEWKEFQKELDPIMNTKFYKDYLRRLDKGRKYAIKKAIESSKLKDNK